MSNRYDTEVQWGGDAAPWHQNGVFVIGGRDNQRAVMLNAGSEDGGQNFRGVMRYAGEGDIGFRATNVGGNTYRTEVQWGGDAAPWHPNGDFVIGGRDNQRCVKISIESGDGGETFHGSMVYVGEGPIGLRTRRIGEPAPAPAPEPAPPAPAPNRRWIFVQGMDSNGNDLGNFGGDKPEAEMIAFADSLQGCVCFNTNGWYKHTLLPREAWSRWTDEPTKGMYYLELSDKVDPPAPEPTPEPAPVPSFSPQGAFVSPILNVSDVGASIAWMRGFGWECIYAFGEPLAYAVVRLGWGLIVLVKDGQGLRGGVPVGPGSGEDAGATWENWWMASPAEVDLMHRLAVANGATVVSPPVDQPWGIRELRIAHPDGHVFRINAVL